MSFARLKESFLRLPKHTQLIGLGSLILAVSTFMPWYADLDYYKIGDQFLGITGPASFVGLAILILAGLSFGIFAYHVAERRTPNLPVREAILHLFVALESLFLLGLVLSIFFDQKFGVNITLKETRFGIPVAFVGALALFIGGYLQNREEGIEKDEVGKLEPLIKMAIEKPEVKMEERTHTPIEPRREEPRKIFPKARNPQGFGYGSSVMPRQAQAQPSQPQVQPQPQTPRPAPSTPKQPSKESGDGSFMVRMDI